jgi:BASS family bile acid:Na+ symporter
MMQNLIFVLACSIGGVHGRRVQTGASQLDAVDAPHPKQVDIDAVEAHDTPSSLAQLNQAFAPTMQATLNNGAAAPISPQNPLGRVAAAPVASAALSVPSASLPGENSGPGGIRSWLKNKVMPKVSASATPTGTVDGMDFSTPEKEPTAWNSRTNLVSLSFLGAAVLSKVAPTLVRAASPKMEGDEQSKLMKFFTAFNNLFALWLAIAAVAGVKVPATFLWVKASYFTALLGLLMFSVGLTTTIDDFKACFDRPGAIAINFISCYGIMPVVAYILAKAIGAEGPILAGMVLVGSVNGGQASNLCTLIAGGDVALSVLMTTSTTLGCIFMTPLICKLVLGSVVPVDAMGIVISTLQVVLAPIFFGVGFNTLFPKICAKIAKFTPTVGVIATVLLVGGSVAKCATPIINAGLPLQLACLGLHLFGGILGYLLTQFFKFDVRTCRTVAIETAMKSSAFGFVLASLHFGTFAVRVPPAVSVVWMAIVGSALAVYWQNKPAKD